MRYRKLPVEIEAVRVADAMHAASRAWDELPPWLADAYERGEVIFANHPSRVLIQTLEGSMTGDLGDWIIRGVKGELYPCKPDVFQATYAPA